MVYSGIYPTDGENFELLREALLKLRLNDPSLTFEPETSQALGFGFRCGFLGLLHMEIVQERLEREYGLSLIATVPSVRYKSILTDGSVIDIENPSSIPDPHLVEHIEEPYVTAQVITPMEYIDAIMRLVKERRGIYQRSEMLDSSRTLITCELPLAEILVDFHDRIKSLSRGYASFDYDFSGYKPSKLIRLDVLVNGALSGRDPGGDRFTSHCQGNHKSPEEECYGQMLRRRCYPQAQAPRKAEARKTQNEECGKRGDSSGGVSLFAQS
jgi:GTP-binding protein LepA